MADVDEILLIHHSHTDIGYTHDQPMVWEIHRRSIDKAITLAEHDLDRDAPDVFKWTIETLGPLLYWLNTASNDQIDRFTRVEAADRIEITGLLANNTTLYDPAEMLDSLEPVRELRERYGFDIEYAMNSDVNGQNWPLVDLLIDAGIEGFSMAINEHFGGAPERPVVFNWEAPSGRTLPTWNGFHYSVGANFAKSDIERIREYFLPHISDRLDAVDYRMDAVPLQAPHIFGDNGPPSEHIPELIRKWNDTENVVDGQLPRLRMATLSEWWGIVEEQAEDIPTWRGDWTDYWTFGPQSTAREVSVHRENRRRLHAADAVEAGLGAIGQNRAARVPHRRAPAEHRPRAWWDQHFVNAHTWVPDNSIHNPFSEDTRSQWNHKGNYVYDARTLSMELQRDAVAELSRQIKHGEVSDNE